MIVCSTFGAFTHVLSSFVTQTKPLSTCLTLSEVNGTSAYLGWTGIKIGRNKIGQKEYMFSLKWNMFGFWPPKPTIFFGLQTTNPKKQDILVSDIFLRGKLRRHICWRKPPQSKRNIFLIYIAINELFWVLFLDFLKPMSKSFTSPGLSFLSELVHKVLGHLQKS